MFCDNVVAVKSFSSTLYVCVERSSNGSSVNLKVNVVGGLLIIVLCTESAMNNSVVVLCFPSGVKNIFFVAISLSSSQNSAVPCADSSTFSVVFPLKLSCAEPTSTFPSSSVNDNGCSRNGMLIKL